MSRVLTDEATRETLARLAQSNRRFAAAYPGDPSDRQPVHTVYGGAHLFTALVNQKLGATALRMFREYAPDFAAFAKALELTGADTLPDSREAVAALARDIEHDPEGGRRSKPAAWFAHAVYR